MNEPWLEGGKDISATSGAKAVAAEAPSGERASTPAYLANQLARGVYQGAGAFADAIPRLYGLAKAGIGSVPIGNYLIPGAPTIPEAISKVTGKPASTYMPELGSPEAYSPTTNFLLSRLTQDLEAPDAGTKFAGAIAEGAGGAVGGGPGIGIGILKQLGLGGLSGAGSEAAGMMTGDNPYARLAGGLAAGLGYGAARTPFKAGANLILNPGGTAAGAGDLAQTAKVQAAPYVQSAVNQQVREAASGTPNAAENITEALRLRQQIPGFNPSVAEASGAPALADMQRRYALSSPEALNTEVARVKANNQSIRDYYDSTVGKAGAPSTVRSAVNQSVADELAALQAKGRDISGQLPVADQMATGSRLTELAQGEKAAARPAIASAYEEAFNAAPAARVPAEGIVSEAEAILGRKLSEIKPENAPQTVSAIQRIFGDKSKEMTGRSVPPDLMALSEVGGQKNLSLRDLHDIRVAIGQDVAGAQRSLDPTAATRLRNLSRLYGPIDDAISKLPPQQGEAYARALDKYKTEFAPRFGEGANLRVFKETSQNEPRILPDKFISEFFKPDSQGGITRSGQFARLFGQNQEAKDLARSGILDLYRQKVVDPNTGAISDTAHNAFVRDYGRTLQNMKGQGVNAMDDIFRIGADAQKVAASGEKLNSLAKALKFDTIDELADAALKSPKVMGNTIQRLGTEERSTFGKTLLDKAWEGGNAAGMKQFLADNEKTLKMAVPSGHLKNLNDIASALEIAERTPLRGQLSAGGTDLLKNYSGVSAATVMSQIRAVTGQRSSVFWAAFNVSSPVMMKLGQKQFSQIMEDALHNPQTAENLRGFMLAQNQAQATSWGSRLLSSIKEGGHLIAGASGPLLRYAAGTDRYKPYSSAVLPASEATMAP